MDYRIAAFYRFFAFPDFREQRSPLARQLCRLGIRGSVLLAPEGINGTIAGTAEAIDKALDLLRSLAGNEGLDVKYSGSDTMPFLRLKVRLKREIVTMGVDGCDPVSQAGTYVAPEDWNRLIADPDTVVIDTRNAYEVAIGTFEGAIDPGTQTFREFPDWFRQFRAGLEAEGRRAKIAMFCTGGIRCEKATSFVKSEGFADVFHLEGGILNYLEKVPAGQSLWRGECFVFDERVSVRADLSPGTHALCHACGHPVSVADQQADTYVEGVSCPACAGRFSAARRARFEERQRQIKLARSRGTAHLGPAPDAQDALGGPGGEASVLSGETGADIGERVLRT